MNDDEFQRLLDELVTGDITSDDHATLQQKLKTDANARTTFRERMDLEAGLRTWAAEPTSASASESESASTSDGSAVPGRRKSAMSPYVVAVGIAAAILLFVGVPAWNHFAEPHAEQVAQHSLPSQTTARLVGFIREQEDCQWNVRPVANAGKMATGKLELSTGVAQLRFDSGTAVTIEGPCEIDITSVDEARLLAGNVCVNVSELSSGFTLLTPESQIIDEGTEYAVSLNDESTEVHVFDGSVIWIPTAMDSQTSSPPFEDRIEAGQARSYSRADPTTAKRIPFGKRQFVRRLEDRLKQHAEGSLIAYDGFENLAGRIRRGRSGFGWADGWQPGGRGRGAVGEIIDCPNDIVFGFDRSQRRLMSLEPGIDIRRTFSQPMDLATGESIYISVLISRQSSSSGGDESSLQISLEPDLPGRGRRLHQIVSFGIAADGFPFIGSGGTITKTATQLAAGETALCVLRLSTNSKQTQPSLRMYGPSKPSQASEPSQTDETIDNTEPSSWTVTGHAGSATYAPASVRIIAGENASWQMDELKIGTTWNSVTQPAE